MRIKVFIYIVISTHFLWSQRIIEKEMNDWEYRMVGDSVWKEAKVPGTIMDNFVDLSYISDPLHPYYGDNEKLYQWVGEQDWEFRTRVVINPSHIGMGYLITFGSLDLFADVYVNNHPIHFSDTISSINAFIPFEVPGVLDWYSGGDGTLTSSLEIRVVFYSTQRILEDLIDKNNLKLPGGERVYGRTAQYQFGWDWGPRFINMGIRKPVRLSIIPKDDYEFSANIHQYNILKDQAIFNLNFTHYNLQGEYKIQHSLYLNGKNILSYRLPVTFQKDVVWQSVPYLIDKPALWWPNGMNSGPNIYTFSFLLTPANDSTRVIAEFEFDYAFCETELVQEKDKYGESFYFKVNGEKVFAKGANYIPDDSFNPGKNTKELITLAREANMNMIRVWGGGTYPDDEFYDECLKNGIMVWQDYMFACAMYPGDEEFTVNAQIETDYQYDRLSKYNNIVAWCGNNENDEGWKNWGWQKEFKYSDADSTMIWNNYLKLFESLPPNNNRYYHSANYISSSPKHGWGRKESMTEGDSHYWGVWWGLEPFEKYNEKVPRFMSEFGMQGMPDISTLNKVIPDSAMNFDSPKFKNHQKHPTGFKTLDHYLKEYLVIPDKMEDYAYATQILQAYALTIAIEAQRRAMPYCMGSLIWQLNDCWPVTSWSLVDSELKTKISYDLVKKSFAPTIISVKEEKDKYSIYITNDNKKIKNSYMQIQILDFYGKVKFKKNISLTVSENTSKPYFKLSKKIVEQFDATSIYLDLQLFKKEKNKKLTYIYDQQYHFAKLNQLKLPQPDLWVEKDGNNLCWIKSKTYCPYVIIQGEANEPNQFIGTVGPRNTVSHPGPDIDLSRIKCLNTLLKK